MPRRLGKDPEIYNIPAHLSFVDQLAEGVMERYGQDPLALSEVLILLPNRRAVRSLRDAFLRLSDGKSTILPNMQPIGDVDEDGLIMGAGALYDDLSVKPAVPPYVRQMILMNIVRSWYVERKEDPPQSAGCAVLGEALGHLLDQVQTEGLEFDELENIVPDEYAIHWQQTIEFLKILTEHWPDILGSTGYMDAALRRNNLLMGLREKWLTQPPGHPIIAAGSTGSVKATSALLAVIARLPQGMIILPGIDIGLDDESWAAIDNTHPQATMKHLLDVVGADRSEVINWSKEYDTEHLKTKIFREIMRPADTTHLWRDLKLDPSVALSGVRQIVTPGIREEAGVIALMMREQLNHPGKTAALVTPDRMLARQVAGELKRWDIEIDDSAGTPLFNMTPGIYLRLIALMVAEKMAPIPLMSALKHPFMSGGIKVGTFREYVRKLERFYLRGPRPAPGADGITKLLNHATQKDDALLKWWENISDAIMPLEALFNKPDVTFAELLLEHITLAEKLAATDEKDGASVLWKGDAGEAAARLVEDLQSAAPYLRDMTADQYPALFDQFMSTVTVRTKYGQHPRLNIWGPLEARLQHADLMILSGLNEGSWPPEQSADPWMSRPMRRTFGLPDLEQKIGLSAHDFVQTASAENVVITRSEKRDSARAVKSRWLSRLHAIIGDREHVEDSHQWLRWFEKLDTPEKFIEIAPPAPTPPVSARPRDLSVTRIQMWTQDPYSLYANKILRLKSLDELDQDPSALDKGNIIHDILEDFMSHYKDHLPDDAYEQLIKIGNNYFADKIDKPTVRAFWWPRFKQIAKWFIEQEKERRNNIKTLATETIGKIDLKLPGGTFSLNAKADRIDQFSDGSLSIIDYK
ncbi:MAG: double-strand break repair protein AddB, partial [Kordiimonadaceae bacterium]|nr:double-strand break repair protein AddB [Kordiimonadaceae bacterium]